MARGQRDPRTSRRFLRPAHQGHRMDRITVIARCNNRELAYLCPIEKLYRPLHRVQ